MDPVTILSVAAATIQFVDFASRVVSTTVEIYRSPSGQTHTEYEASTLVGDLAYLATQIRDKDKLFEEDRPHHVASESERQLRRLCDECLEINDDIKSALSTAEENGMKSFCCGKHPKLCSFGKAVEKVLGSKKVKELIRRIDYLRQQMMMSILVCLW